MDLEKLNLHVRNLVTLSETDSPLISCYVNLEAGRASYRDALDARIKEIRRALPSDQRHDFEQALGRLEVFLASEINPEANGVALFSRGGGSPFFLALQFRVPLPNLILADSVPHIYELVVLKDTYHRYIVLISTETHARIVEVSVGNVTKELWTKQPELRKRVGREWTSEHYQNHRRDRTEKFIKEKIEILDRLVAKDEHTHLILAGNPRTVARVRARLPKRLQDKLIEPPRLCRRLYSLRGWSHGTNKQVFPGGPRASGADGLRARERVRLRMGGDLLDCGEDRMFV